LVFNFEVALDPEEEEEEVNGFELRARLDTLPVA